MPRVKFRDIPAPGRRAHRPALHAALCITFPVNFRRSDPIPAIRARGLPRPPAGSRRARPAYV